MRSVTLAFLLGLAAQTDSAHSGEKEKPAPRPHAAPRDAFAQAMVALADGDEAKAFAAIRTTTDEQKDFLRALMTFNQAGLRFRAAFIKAYGPKAWATFQDPNQGPKEGNASLSLILREDVKQKVDEAVIEEKGDAAVIRLRGEPKDAKGKKLVKVDGTWVLDLDGNFVPTGSFAGEKLAKLTKTLTAMSRLVDKYQKAIGAKYEGKEISADDVDAELGRAFLQALTGQTSDLPHRFDVEKLK